MTRDGLGPAELRAGSPQMGNTLGVFVRHFLRGCRLEHKRRAGEGNDQTQQLAAGAQAPEQCGRRSRPSLAQPQHE